MSWALGRVSGFWTSWGWVGIVGGGVLTWIAVAVGWLIYAFASNLLVRPAPTSQLRIVGRTLAEKRAEEEASVPPLVQPAVQVWMFQFHGAADMGYAQLGEPDGFGYETIRFELLNHGSERLTDVEVKLSGEGVSRTRMGNQYFPQRSSFTDVYLKNLRGVDYVNGHGESAQFILMSRDDGATPQIWWGYGSDGVPIKLNSRDGMQPMHWDLKISVISSVKTHHFRVKALTIGRDIMFAYGGKFGGPIV